MASSGRLPGFVVAMWRRLFGQRESVRARSVEEVIAETPELARLFSRFGHDPGREVEIRRILADMKTLIRAEVPDFDAFQRALTAAAARPDDSGAQFEVRHQKLAEAILRAGNDSAAVMELLNRDPVYEQVPFIERVPLRRGGEITWVTPIDHSYIQKRPSDPIRFEQLIDALDQMYAQPLEGRRDAGRLQVLEALARLRREAKREKAYLPTAIQFLESRVNQFESESLEPAAAEAIATLTKIVESVESVWGQNAREAAQRYLSDARLHLPWLSNYLLGALLRKDAIEVVAWPRWRVRRMAELIRSEIESGFYDAAEIAGRVRRLEGDGLYVSSLLYGLLGLKQKGRAKITSEAGRVRAASASESG